MSNVAMKGCATCLCHTPELAFHHGSTPAAERQAHPDSEFLAALPGEHGAAELLDGAVLAMRRDHRLAVTAIGPRLAGLDEALGALGRPAPARYAVAAPPAHPVDREIPGVDVLDMEAAIRAVWGRGIYAESAMGCTGPVVRVAAKDLDAAKLVLAEAGYI